MRELSQGRRAVLLTPLRLPRVTDTGFGPGCIDIINLHEFGSPATAARCGADPIAGLGQIIGTSGLFPGVPLSIDTSTAGTRLFQCMLHPWMRTTVTVE